MKNHYYFFMFPFFLTASMPLIGNPIIYCTFKPLPDSEKITTKLKNPGKIAKHTINGIAEPSPIAGICVTYAGYLDVSDNNGEVSFPRKHTKDRLDIIITPAIEPVPLFNQTIQHWKLPSTNNAAMYSLKQIHNEKDNDYEWHTEKVSLPSDNIIPLTAMVIIAKASNIVIPSEITKTRQTANLTLPPIYVKKGINIVSNSSYFLNIRHLFRPVETQEKRTPLRLTIQLLE